MNLKEKVPVIELTFIVKSHLFWDKLKFMLVHYHAKDCLGVRGKR
jgi:hypothetical protein